MNLSNHKRAVWRRQIPTFATVILFPLLLSLGFWQLDRAQQKRNMLSVYTHRGQLEPLSLDQPLDDIETLHYRRVRVQGHYDAAHLVLLDNKVYQGRVGYHVLIPLHVTGADVHVLINRGWVPLGKSRQTLPDISVKSGPVTVSGIIHLPSSQVFALGDIQGDRDGGKDDWPAVVQWLDIAHVAQQMGYPLQEFVILQDPPEADDLANGPIRQWVLTVSSPERHTAYAVQWFALSAVLVIIYIVLSLRKVKSAAR